MDLGTYCLDYSLLHTFFIKILNVQLYGSVLKRRNSRRKVGSISKLPTQRTIAMPLDELIITVFC